LAITIIQTKRGGFEVWKEDAVIPLLILDEDVKRGAMVGKDDEGRILNQEVRLSRGIVGGTWVLG